MSLGSEFLVSWKQIEGVIKLEVDREFKRGTGVDTGRLKSLYLNQIQKWTVTTFYEGQWLKGVQDEDFEKRFLASMKDIDFQVTEQEKRSSLAPVIGLILVGLIWCLKIILSKSTIIALVASIIALGGSGFFYLKGRQESLETYHKQVRKEIVQILEQKGQELFVLCEEKGGKQ